MTLDAELDDLIQELQNIKDAKIKEAKGYKELINDINEKKEVHPCQQFFYSNETDLFKDSQHRSRLVKMKWMLLLKLKGLRIMLNKCLK